ncbi:DUF1835 domain-containing protein [Bacillus sp. PS06]|uniref:DUF1835 domain-containing protein n=1 Tax=Bacillus sp. PS06 TaxID=2764176 RepID=UPI00177DEA91|nr:DUF1835 domain-containing protein [Bacillus sp. PS06]MBD8069717.1 DUF1835 domain-containing protein [Bacillus sp. PS06]
MQMKEMRESLAELSAEEAKSLLFQMYLRMNLLKETGYSEREFINDVGKIFETVSKLTNEREDVKKHVQAEKVHILFGLSSAGSLRMALKKMKVHEAEQIISFRDIFSIGPIEQLHERSGQERRIHWMNKVMNADDDFPDYLTGFYNTINLITSIPEHVPIMIWTSDSAHEQMGLRYALYLLKDKTNDIKVINTTKAHAEHFSRPDIQYTILSSGELFHEQLQMIYEQSHPKTLSEDERKELEQEWLALAETNETLRIWRNGQIKSVEEDYFDKYIINLAKKLQLKRGRDEETELFMKSARLIGEVIGHLDQYIGDQFFEYRLRMLVDKGVFEMKGDMKAMRFYSVRLADHI